ncbi:hypothetical protein [Methanobrevibacter sp.]|uniref:hypothetical protein n=1 Tax=Methanobrevibacter sp. TaxID=66852 RepID=UPI0025E3371B|nr:hypothetical protein [Methanobrevibacter sp.]MBQ2665919.1 hypothetical protein [Methanobrevibacter sp.]
MNYKKIILVGFISAFVAILTSVLGVAGTVIGSVISSMLYNMLSEALEKPVSSATFSTDFEWEIAYIFPLIVIALIQLLLIFALLSGWGLLPQTFLTAFLSLQQFANYNLYRILGIAMLVISVYPLILKPDIIKKSHGAIIAFVGLIFLARGFVDLHNAITNVYDVIFTYFDFPIAVIALVLILFVIFQILISARQYQNEFSRLKRENSNDNATKKINVRNSRKGNGFDYDEKMKNIKNHKKRSNKSKPKAEVNFKEKTGEKTKSGINESTSKIHFESNDLLDDYKKQ